MELSADEVLAIVVPIAVYWIYSGFCSLLAISDKYRLHSMKDEETKNMVPKREAIKGVIFVQLLQAGVAFVTLTMCTKKEERKQESLSVVACQLMVGMLVMDTWQYFWHRYMHVNKFLYRHVHSRHHRLVAPYAFAAQYTHPVEGFLLDTLGGALGFVIAGMTPRTSIFFFSLAVVKSVDDHCGLWLPGNIFHVFFWNNTAYHDVHHQLGGNKYNFSQPFFVTWDMIMGTYMPYTLEKREGGGLQARPKKP